MDKNYVNGIGSAFRLITPILLALMLFILSGMRGDIRETKQDYKVMAGKFDTYSINHLQHHMDIEKTIGERLASIEAKIPRYR